MAVWTLNIKQEGNGPLDLRALGQWKRPQICNQQPQLLQVKQKRNRNAWAALVSAEMFLQRGLLGGHGRSADAPPFRLISINYPGIHMHIASESHFHGLWRSSGFQITSEVTSEVRFEFSCLNYLCSHACSLACKYFPQMIETTDNGANYDPFTLRSFTRK